jgi:hypothetical protein
MTALSTSTHRSVIGKLSIHSAVLGITSSWDALAHELETGVNNAANLVIELPTDYCDCDLDIDDDGVTPCGHGIHQLDVIGLWNEDRSRMYGVELVFFTPELTQRAAAALAASGVTPENPSYPRALEGIHDALRAEIAQWAPVSEGLKDGSMRFEGDLCLGDAYLLTEPQFEIDLRGDVSLVWFLDDSGELVRLQMIVAENF